MLTANCLLRYWSVESCTLLFAKKNYMSKKLVMFADLPCCYSRCNFFYIDGNAGLSVLFLFFCTLGTAGKICSLSPSPSWALCLNRWRERGWNIRLCLHWCRQGRIKYPAKIFCFCEMKTVSEQANFKDFYFDLISTVLSHKYLQ